MDSKLQQEREVSGGTPFAEARGSAASAADALGVGKEYDAFMAAVASARDGLDDVCPRCGSSAQVWPNQLTGKLTCHRVGCHLELPLNDPSSATRP